VTESYYFIMQSH